MLVFLRKILPASLSIMPGREHNFEHDAKILGVTLKSVTLKFSSILYQTLSSKLSVNSWFTIPYVDVCAYFIPDSADIPILFFVGKFILLCSGVFFISEIQYQCDWRLYFWRTIWNIKHPLWYQEGRDKMRPWCAWDHVSVFQSATINEMSFQWGLGLFLVLKNKTRDQICCKSSS